MGVELELAVVLLIVILGSSIFAVFELETALWRKLLRWLMVAGGTVGLYYGVGHWALLLALVLGALGGAFHFVWCRRYGIHLLNATPREKYYELRGWTWPQ